MSHNNPCLVCKITDDVDVSFVDPSALQDHVEMFHPGETISTAIYGDRMIRTGDQVRVSGNGLHEDIRPWVHGKIGTVTADDPGLHDLVVCIEGTPRIGGLFALDLRDVEKVN